MNQHSSINSSDKIIVGLGFTYMKLIKSFETINSVPLSPPSPYLLKQSGCDNFSITDYSFVTGFKEN